MGQPIRMYTAVAPATHIATARSRERSSRPISSVKFGVEPVVKLTACFDARLSEVGGVYARVGCKPAPGSRLACDFMRGVCLLFPHAPDSHLIDFRVASRGIVAVASCRCQTWHRQNLSVNRPQYSRALYASCGHVRPNGAGTLLGESTGQVSRSLSSSFTSAALSLSQWR